MLPCFAGVPFHAALTSRQVVSCHSPLCVSLVYQDREPTNSAQSVCIHTGLCYPSNPYEARRDVPPHLTAQIRGGVSGSWCRYRPRVGQRRLRQRRCGSWYAWSPKGRWRCGSSHRSAVREETDAIGQRVQDGNKGCNPRLTSQPSHRSGSRYEACPDQWLADASWRSRDALLRSRGGDSTSRGRTGSSHVPGILGEGEQFVN
jgi:hypothetical protein